MADSAAATRQVPRRSLKGGPNQEYDDYAKDSVDGVEQYPINEKQNDGG